MGEKELRAGAIGLALLSMVPILMNLGDRIAYRVFWSTGGVNESYDLRNLYYSTFGIVAFSVFLIFAILLLISTRRAAPRFEGSNLGKVGAVFGVTTALTNVIYYLFFILGISLDSVPYDGGLYYYLTPNIIADIMLLVTLGLFGSTMVIIGIFFIIYRKNFSYRGLWIATGIAFIIVGGLEFVQRYYTSMWEYIGWIIIESGISIPLIEDGLIFVAGILGARRFLAGKPLEIQKVSE